MAHFCSAISSCGLSSTHYGTSSLPLNPPEAKPACLTVRRDTDGGSLCRVQHFWYSLHQVLCIVCQHFCGFFIGLWICRRQFRHTMDSQWTSKGDGQFLTLRDNVCSATVTGNWQAEQANLLVQMAQNCMYVRGDSRKRRLVQTTFNWKWCP